MNCLYCTNKQITNEYEDNIIKIGQLRELNRDCNKCGNIFIIYKDKDNEIKIKDKYK